MSSNSKETVIDHRELSSEGLFFVPGDRTPYDKKEPEWAAREKSPASATPALGSIQRRQATGEVLGTWQPTKPNNENNCSLRGVWPTKAVRGSQEHFDALATLGDALT